MLPYPCAAVYRFSTSIKYCDSARRRRLLEGINLRSVERGESRGPWRGRTRGEKERGLGGEEMEEEIYVVAYGILSRIRIRSIRIIRINLIVNDSCCPGLLKIFRLDFLG